MKPNWKKFAKRAFELGRRCGHREGYAQCVCDRMIDESEKDPVASEIYGNRVVIIFEDGETRTEWFDYMPL